jgi:hypothetical protein
VRKAFPRLSVSRPKQLDDVMDDRYLTRRELVDALRQEAGIPISLSRMNKLAAEGLGPRVVAYWGRRPLYTFPDGFAWAQQRLRRSKAQPAA